MPRGDKSSYSSKQKRQVEHIEEGYEKRGTSKKEAERRAWATVNKQDKGAKRAAADAGKKIQPCKFAQRWTQRRQSEEKIGIDQSGNFRREDEKLLFAIAEAVEWTALRPTCQ